MRFRDRSDAGQRLAGQLLHLRGEDVVVLGLPRGGVAVAAEVASVLGAPLDVILVRKLGVPVQPELGMGAIGEGDARVINPEVVRFARVSDQQIAAVEDRERAELLRRARRYRGDRTRVPLAGRIAVVVDDGIATGSTARAACQVAKALGARRVVMAVPVAPRSARGVLAGDADEMICLEMPDQFLAIGEWYDDFSQASDEEVISLLWRATMDSGQAGTRGIPGQPGTRGIPGQAGTRGVPGQAGTRGVPGQAGTRGVPGQVGATGSPQQPAGESSWDQEVTVPAGTAGLPGHLTIPRRGTGIVVFAHGSGSSRHSPRNGYVAATLNHAGLGTLMFDLLTADEEQDRANVFDIELLASRLLAATRWLREQPAAMGSRIGYFGASTGAAAALWAAAEAGGDVAAVVSRGGRPDLALPQLRRVQAATLLIVGGLDDLVLGLNRTALDHLLCENHLAVVAGATHLFEERGTLERVADLAREWFTRHLTPAHASM